MAGELRSKTSVKLLRDGNKIPVLGLGTYMLSGETALVALQQGYRLLDTATLYE